MGGAQCSGLGALRGGGIPHCGWGHILYRCCRPKTEGSLHRALRTLCHRGGIGFDAVAAWADRRLSLGTPNIKRGSLMLSTPALVLAIMLFGLGLIGLLSRRNI